MSYTVNVNAPPVRSAARTLRKETGKKVTQENIAWYTEQGVMSAVYVKQSADRSKRAKIEGDKFDIANTRCMFNKVPMTYKSMAMMPEGREAIEAQIEFHENSAETHSQRAQQKRDLLDSISV